jgi:hypothetical protein
MSSPEMMSSRPQHEISKPQNVMNTANSMQKGFVDSKELKK